MSVSERYAYSLNALAEGYRLQTLEIYNWGTFHNVIWSVSPGGNMTVLAGENGSGKSTLVDALITLIVPPIQRGYNLASGAEGRKRGERDPKSYFHGEYGRARSEDGDVAKRLRESGTYTVLLGVFQNPATSKVITLAQLLYQDTDGGLKPVYIVAEKQLSIREAMGFNGNVPAFKRRLQGMEARTYTEFSAYSADFKKLFGLRSDNALKLFNRIVAMKEIGKLNDFIRDYMLEPLNVNERIEQLYRNYQNLTQAYESIRLDERRLEQLKPISEGAISRDRLTAQIEEARRCADVVPAYFAYKKIDLLDTAIRETKESIAYFQGEADRARLSREIKQKEKEDLRISIENDDAGRRMERIKVEIHHRREIMGPRQRGEKKYTALAMKLGLSGYGDSQAFHANIRAAQAELDEILQEQESLTPRLRELGREEDRVQTKCDELQENLQALKGRKSQLPPALLGLRERMAAELDIPESSLPFIGELLKVRDEESRWEAAIEKLLRGYAQQMLVPERYYAVVRHYVNQTRLNGKIVYLLVSENRQQPEIPREREMLFYKMEINPDADRVLTSWLRADLIRYWDYRCVQDVQQFANLNRALTVNGQIKHNATRHEKDDRNFGNRADYFLGWDNRAKIEALAKLLHHQEQARARLAEQIAQLHNQQEALRQRLQDLNDLRGFTDFADIDWATDQRQIEDLEAERQQLGASSDHLHQLQKQLQAAEVTLAELENTMRQCDYTLGTHNKDLERYEQDRERCIAISREAPAGAEQYVERIEARLKGKDLTLQNADLLSSDTQNYFHNSASSYQGRLKSTEDDLLHRLSTFVRDFHESSTDLDPSLEALPGFLALKARIERDDLPRHQERFRDLMNENIAQDILDFRAELENKEREYMERIDALNDALKRIRYEEHTHIQLRFKKTSSSGEVSQFRASLNAAIPNQMRPDLLETYFEPIRLLIEKLKNETAWAKRVTDPRQWLEFYAQEIEEDGREGEVYSDSSGKSGGQKAKLAYTVLASAIADQYGINQEDEDATRTFRFVVVDEVFSKLDERNARFAMELFQQLKLQVMVVTPMDKLHIAEPFVGAVHIVSNPDGSNSSVLNLTINEYRARRAEFMGGRHTR